MTNKRSGELPDKDERGDDSPEETPARASSPTVSVYSIQVSSAYLPTGGGLFGIQHYRATLLLFGRS